MSPLFSLVLMVMKFVGAARTAEAEGSFLEDVASSQLFHHNILETIVACWCTR